MLAAGLQVASTCYQTPQKLNFRGTLIKNRRSEPRATVMHEATAVAAGARTCGKDGDAVSLARGRPTESPPVGHDAPPSRVISPHCGRRGGGGKATVLRAAGERGAGAGERAVGAPALGE